MNQMMYKMMKIITLYLFYYQPYVNRRDLLLYVREYFSSDFYFYLSMMLGVNYMTRIMVDIFYMSLYYFRLESLEKYHINKVWLWENDKNYNNKVIKTIIHYMMLNMIIFIPLTYISYDLNIDYMEVDLWYVSVIQIMISLVIYDFIFYWIHRMLHMKQFYWIHKMHHEYVNTVIWADANTDIIETILVAVLPNILIGYMINMKMYTQLMLIIISISLGISQHSNYNLPYSPFDLIPFCDTIKNHVLHHKLFTVNYAPYWSFWDRVFNTYAD